MLEILTLVDVREYERILPNGKGILGELTIWEIPSASVKLGVVTFVIAAGPSSPVRGTEMFNEMMDSFGADANIIQGTWRKPPSGDESTNIDKVNELTGQGVPLVEAVQHAWNVTRARKRSFGPAIVMGSPTGVPGSYVAIDVEMKKTP